MVELPEKGCPVGRRGGVGTSFYSRFRSFILGNNGDADELG